MNAPGRVLAVDLGLKRTGLAISDELRITTRGLEIFATSSRRADVDRIAAHVKVEDVRVVVVGHPTLPRSGDEGAMAKRARGFADVLAASVPCEVVLVDEGGSSKEATARLVEAGAKKKRRAEPIDDQAARVILERWLAEQAPTGA